MHESTYLQKNQVQRSAGHKNELCKYFLEGCCRFGDSCKNIHALSLKNNVVLVIAPIQFDLNGVSQPMFDKFTGITIGIDVPRNHMIIGENYYTEVLSYIIEKGYHISSVNVTSKLASPLCVYAPECVQAPQLTGTINETIMVHLAL